MATVARTAELLALAAGDDTLVAAARFDRGHLRLLADDDRAIGERAAGLAAMLGGHLLGLAGRKVVLLLTGGNIDPLAHSRVIERGLAADGRLYRCSQS